MMRVLQIGHPKSGNYWLWRIIEELLRLAGEPPRSFVEQQPIYEIVRDLDLSFPEQARVDCIDVRSGSVCYEVYPIFKMPIDHWDRYLSEVNHVWSHSRYCGQTQRVATSFDHAVYVVRDPRDVVMSLARFDLTPVRQKFYGANVPMSVAMARNADRVSRSWIRHVRPYLVNRRSLNLQVVFYERLLADFCTEVTRLAGALGIPAERDEISRIESRLSFGAMKKQAPKHVALGRAGGWRSDLDPDLVEMVTEPLYPFLHDLGYAVAGEDDGGEEWPLPELRDDRLTAEHWSNGSP